MNKNTKIITIDNQMVIKLITKKDNIKWNSSFTWNLFHFPNEDNNDHDSTGIAGKNQGGT